MISECVIGVNGIKPVYKTIGAAALDLFTPSALNLDVGLHKINTTVAIAIPEGYYGEIKCRSSMGIAGCSVEAGIIDSDYRGEIIVLLRVRNTMSIPKGHAIAQLIIKKAYRLQLNTVELFSTTTERGAKGFGSTNNTTLGYLSHKEQQHA